MGSAVFGRFLLSQSLPTAVPARAIHKAWILESRLREMWRSVWRRAIAVRLSGMSKVNKSRVVMKIKPSSCAMNDERGMMNGG